MMGTDVDGQCYGQEALVMKCRHIDTTCQCGSTSSCMCIDMSGDCCYQKSTDFVYKNVKGDIKLTADGLCPADVFHSPLTVVMAILIGCLFTMACVVVIAAYVAHRRKVARRRIRNVRGLSRPDGVAPSMQYQEYDGDGAVGEKRPLVPTRTVHDDDDAMDVNDDAWLYVEGQ